MCAKEGNQLAGGAEQEADDGFEQARQQGGKFFPIYASLFAEPVGHLLESIGDRADNNTDGCADRNENPKCGEPAFFKHCLDHSCFLQLSFCHLQILIHSHVVL